MHYSTGILVILLFLIFIKGLNKEKGLLFLALYSLIDILLNLFNSYITGKWSLYIWSTFTFIEYSIFTYLLWVNIKNKSFKWIVIVLSIAFIVFTTIYNIITNFKSIDSIPIGIETILIFIYSFYYLYEQMNDTTNLFIYSKYQFWIVIGILIYLAGSFFIFIFASRMEDDLLSQYWYITNAFYAVMNIMICIGFYVKSRKTKNLYSQSLRPYLN